MALGIAIAPQNQILVSGLALASGFLSTPGANSVPDSNRRGGGNGTTQPRRVRIRPRSCKAPYAGRDDCVGEAVNPRRFA
jgi:hypothetical protein